MAEILMSVMAVLAAVVVLGRARMRWRLRRQQLVRREAHRAWHVELRRRVGMSSHADGLGGQSFPTPIETRTLSLLVCDVPLWTRTESIGLPIGSEARLDELAAGDYDHHFTSTFRLAQPAGAARRAARTTQSMSSAT